MAIELNSEQIKAITCLSPHLLVLAGAGSGKTAVLTRRIGFFIETLSLHPQNILALTFTNKAASEMRERAIQLCPQAVWSNLSTFHSFGAKFLRRYAHQMDLSPTFSIYDDDESLSILKNLYPKEPLNQLKTWRNAISRLKDQAITSDTMGDHPVDVDRLSIVYKAYQQSLRENQAIDFSDLILKPLLFLRENPMALTYTYQAILVDEYQDTNVAQAMLLHELAKKADFVTVVGDEDQSIYRFRGAEPINIIEFPRVYTPCEVIKLEQNYRSSGHILACANAVIAQNKGRLGKTLFTKDELGIKPVVHHFLNAENEVHFCVEQAKICDSLNDLAILYRTNAQSRLLETGLLQANISYRLIGAIRFYEREEIKLALCLLSLLLNPHDEVAFKKAIKTPSRGVGEKSLAKLMLVRQEKKISLIEACEQQTIAGKTGKYLKEFADNWHKMHTLITKHTLEVCLSELCQQYGLNIYYQERDRLEGTERLTHLAELASMISIYPSGLAGLSQFIENMSLKNSHAEDTKDEKVTLITIHNTKGLEYPTVIITGMEEQLFPRIDELDLDKEDQLEEERRLCYVAITRARTKLHLSYCYKRLLYGKTHQNHPSRFLYELPPGHFEEQAHGLNRTTVPSQAAPLGNFSVNSLVRHADYGIGKILSSQHANTHLVLEVMFQNSKKPIKIIPAFIHLERIHPNELE